MQQRFHSIDAVLSSPILSKARAYQPHARKGEDRVLKATRLEDTVYHELRGGDKEMDGLEERCRKKLASFPALERDIYQSFYSFRVQRRDDENLSGTARRFNAPILDHVMGSDAYPTIKAACEGRKLPAYEAAAEFTSQVADSLDQLLKDAAGGQKALETLEHLEEQKDAAMKHLQDLIAGPGGKAVEPELIKAANAAQSKARQVEAVSRMIQDDLMKNKEEIRRIVAAAAQAAAEKAQEADLALRAWGDGADDGADPKRMELRMELLQRVRQSPALREITRYLGRYKELLTKARKNGYAYGRGEKYTLEYGGKLGQALSSEFALLAAPETLPLFLRKLQRRALKQYRRREPVCKGSGDIICCLDESYSTKKTAPWGKAVALTLLDAAMAGNRSFSLVHFSSRGRFQTDLFRPGQYTPQDVLAAAETFLDGNTDYETPMSEALRLMEEEGFENADIVFVTDGECEMPDEFITRLRRAQAARKFSVTGVLLDADTGGFVFTLAPFCNDIYRTSELSSDEVARALITARA